MRKINKKTYKFGILAEKIAILFLQLKGYKILQSRFKTRAGEVDIIAKKSNIIIFIEVKARKGNYLIEEVLRKSQISRIRRAAEIFISKKPKYHNSNLRFDFIEVGKFFIPKHHKNFF